MYNISLIKDHTHTCKRKNFLAKSTVNETKAINTVNLWTTAAVRAITTTAPLRIYARSQYYICEKLWREHFEFSISKFMLYDSCFLLIGAAGLLFFFHKPMDTNLKCQVRMKFLVTGFCSQLFRFLFQQKESFWPTKYNRLIVDSQAFSMLLSVYYFPFGANLANFPQIHSNQFYKNHFFGGQLVRCQNKHIDGSLKNGSISKKA